MIPAGLEVTVPLPVPALSTLSGTLLLCALSKVAVTVFDAVIVIVQVVPENVSHPEPAQPANVEPAAAVAVSVTVVPLA